MPDLKVAACRVFVSDVAVALPFYRDKLGLPLRVAADDGSFAVFEAGIMLILEPSTDEPELAGRFAGLSLEVPDMAAAFQHLSDMGVEFDGPPVTEEWGGSVAHFKDPGGNTLTIVEYPKQ